VNGSALERWDREIQRWGVPEDILAKAPESPWGFPTELFRHRADRAPGARPTATTRRALEALPPGGTVLDVGVGGGATSLPLAGSASAIVGVDPSEEMLQAFREAAADLDGRVDTIQGTWPDVAPRSPMADVVVCGHVLYNGVRLGPFARALDGHAHRRVVIEMTAEHPLAWMRDLWRRFHGLERPTRPTAVDAFEGLAELGLPVRREETPSQSRGGGFERREDAIALVRRRLCLRAERDAELADALGERLIERDGLWSTGRPETLVSLWWDVRR
jgi:SAM-dependent methyltransferase